MPNPNQALYDLAAINHEIENYNASNGVLEKLSALNKITQAFDQYFKNSNELRKQRYQTLSSKFSFDPAKNRDTAAENIKSSSVATAVCFRKNSNVDALNSFGKCASNIYSRFNIKRPLSLFGVKGAPNQPATALRSKCSTRALACYISTVQRVEVSGNNIPMKDEIAFNNVKCQPSYIDRMTDERNKRLERYITITQERVKNSSFVDPAVKDLVTKLTDYGWTVGVSLDDTFTHELGHLVHRHNENKINPILKNAYSGGWYNLISEYAKSSPSELFAETMCLYINYPDQHWRIEPNLLLLLHKMDLSKNETF